jgi:ubiquinone/menaquinone biosynthesis C-methylase UbiE
MFKSFLKNILPDFILNLILKLYISFVRLRTFKTSQSFWNENTVSSPKNGFKSIEESMEHLKWRNNQYINSEKNMYFKNTQKKIVLDYGCGPGNGLINIINTSNPKKIYAVDVSEKSIYLAKKRAKLHNLNVSFIKINENEKINSIDDNSIDVIKSDGVLHHIENVDFVLREFKRILKKNGVINLMIYNRDSLWFHLHVNYELMIKKKIFSNSSDEEVFKISTDGFQCPVSYCFSPSKFIEICKKNKFRTKLKNVSISLFELSKVNLIKEAINSEKIKLSSKDFLKQIYFKRRIPYFRKNIAGINAYYELRNF